MGIGGPDKRLWHLVGFRDEALDGGPKLGDGPEDAAFETLFEEFGEISLHGIEPRTGCGREMEGEPLMAGEPCQDRGVLVGGVIVENDMDGFAARNLGIESE